MVRRLAQGLRLLIPHNLAIFMGYPDAQNAAISKQLNDVIDDISKE